MKNKDMKIKALVTLVLLNCTAYTSVAMATENYASSMSTTHSINITPAPLERKTADYSNLTIITAGDIPESLKEKIYNRPVQNRTIDPSSLRMPSPTAYDLNTLVSQKIQGLEQNLGSLQNQVENLALSLNEAEIQSDSWAADYYASIATINTQLQSGTTPGNPRLVSHLKSAESKLEYLTQTLQRLNMLSAQAAELSTKASFLLEESRAAYGISGAVEEDHARLARLEDSIANTTLAIERVLNNTSDSMTRTSGYLSSERDNLRTLALAVSKGDLYGKSLANRPFSSAAGAYTNASLPAASEPAAQMQEQQYSSGPATLSSPRPLAKIRFDRTDVAYEEPLYTAVNEALQRYPNARFDLVAVQPSQGNAAQVAIESTKARRNAERVLRTLTEMGLSMEKIDLSYSKSQNSSVNEVHLYVK